MEVVSTIRSNLGTLIMLAFAASTAMLWLDHHDAIIRAYVCS